MLKVSPRVFPALVAVSLFLCPFSSPSHPDFTSGLWR